MGNAVPSGNGLDEYCGLVYVTQMVDGKCGHFRAKFNFKFWQVIKGT
jgi:hypothetical protein